MKYNTFTLPNGLRVIHLPSASPVVYCGYEIKAGAADELPGEEGLAHFCEHTTFKGTARRSAIDIINSIESVGGDLNAFTTKTDTVYYCAIMKEHLDLAIDVLTDIVFHSTYPQSEIDKEVEVICDEIESYNDSPAELIYDEFENLIFRGTPLGHNILGSADRVRKFTTADALRFTKRLYRPDNAILFVYGGETDSTFLTQALPKREGCLITERLLRASQQSPNTNQLLGNQTSSPWGRLGGECGLGEEQRVVRSLHTHQAHVMLGSRAYAINHPRRMALYLLNNILGGPGMSARLNISLRERRGLVYTVESSMVSYAHTGLWAVYFGCDKDDIDACLALVRQELDKLMNKPLSADELAQAKQQIKGQIGIACDNRESFALDFGKVFLHYGWEKDIDEVFRNIDALTSDDLLQAARDIFPQRRITTLIFR